MTKQEFIQKYDGVKMVVSEELSKRVQEKLFKVGCTWIHGETRLIATDTPYLFLEKGKLTLTCLYESFRDKPFKEILASDILKEKVEVEEKVTIKVFADFLKDLGILGTYIDNLVKARSWMKDFDVVAPLKYVESFLTIQTAFRGGFSWVDTPQGVAYWLNREKEWEGFLKEKGYNTSQISFKCS